LYSKSNYHCGSFNVVAVPNNAKEQKEAKREPRLEKSENARDLSRRCGQRFRQTIAERERKRPGRLKKSQSAGDRPRPCGRQFHRAVSERGEDARKRETSDKNHERDALFDG
jgi:hypothetical protein